MVDRNSESVFHEEASTYFRPKTWVSFVIVAFLICSMCSAIFVTGVQLHITMMISMGFSMLLLAFDGCSYKKLEAAIIYGGKLLIPTLVLLYCIGALIGAWIAGGTVPMIIYWGLRLIDPKYFLVTACLACMVVSMASGSSWSTIGTVGVALMGVGVGLNVNPAMTAGAVVSGAAFGDKMSPLSDTTNVAPAVAEADLFDHIRAMLYTGGPAIVLALAGFAILGFQTSGTTDEATVLNIMTSLHGLFRMNVLTLIPALIVLLLALKRFPAFPTLLISMLTAALLAVVMQGQSIPSILTIMEQGFVSNTGVEQIDKLLTRGGIFSMNYNCGLSTLVMVYGGILEKCGVLDVLLEKMHSFTKTVGRLVATTVCLEIFLNLITASQYMTIILGGKLMMPAYRKHDLLPQCLSRTLEDSGTVTSLLIPWNLCGAFATAAIGVNSFSYLPYALFNWLCPLIAVIWGFTGLFQWRTGAISSKRTYRREDSVVDAE